MTRPLRIDFEADFPAVLDRLNRTGEGAPTIEEKLQVIQSIRAGSQQAGVQMDRFFLDEIARLREALARLDENQEKLRAVIDKLTASPWHPAVFLGLADFLDGEAAMVLHGSARRVVKISDDVDAYSLEVGDEVLLASEFNVILDRSPYRFSRCGETATFDRYAPDGRIVLRARDEEMVVDVAGLLAGVELKSGDLLRWDRAAWMAFEKIERTSGESFFLEGTPQETFASIGGLDAQIERLQRTIGLHLYHRETVRRYHLRRKGSVLLVGPPGTGKTMIARALANWLGEISPSGRARFMNIKPASLHSMWYSQSEANYREAFRIAREAGDEEPDVPVVMFFDEIDSIASARGDAINRVNDNVLNAFMAELNGLEERGNILVVAATNRLDALDPAITRDGRLGDDIIEVPRPNMRAARDIFARHLRADIPYAPSDTSDAATAREQIIASAVSRIYAPNGDSEIATLVFRDGKRRTVRAADLISGASIAKIARAAIERACMREIEAGESSGIQLADVLAAVSEEIEAMARVLSPASCRKHLTDLPQDVDVVRVEPIQRKVARPHRYLNVA